MIYVGNDKYLRSYMDGIPIPLNVKWNKLRRARRDYFKTFLCDMPQELVEMIQAVVAWLISQLGYGAYMY
jgi:hypothetical protein